MRASVLTVAFAIMALGCTSPTEADVSLLVPDALQLVGRWQSARESVNVVGSGGFVLWTGSYQTTIDFGANGDAVVDVRQYGLYPGQVPGDLSAYNTSTGSFRVTADSLVILQDRAVWWDRFYGANSPEHVDALAAGRTYFSHARFRVEGNRLTLDYLTYPGDAPVPTTAVYQRAN